uniref:BEACH domain-containing protein n=1 Tax=Ascaris lumbricoides TaxID=6252 RepID=A0A0M3IX98_ASCLU
MVRTYGQMPTQLFLSPHLPHLTAKANHLSRRKSPVSDFILCHGLLFKAPGTWNVKQNLSHSSKEMLLMPLVYWSLSIVYCSEV